MENTHFYVYEQECEIAFLFFKTKPMTQVFITDMQVKAWKSLYAFIFVWICSYFGVYKFLSGVSVKECSKN